MDGGHPLQDSGGSISLAPGADRKNPGSSAAGGTINLASSDYLRKNPPATSSSSSTAGIPSSAAAAADGIPCAAPLPGPDAARDVQFAMAQHMAWGAASQAGSVLKKGASTVVVHVKANPYSVTIMSFVGGVCLVVASIMHLVLFANISNPLPYILRIYELAFGVLVVVIDEPTGRIPDSLRARAWELAPFTPTNTNRILFYLFIACLQGSLPSWWNTFTGWYFAIVALFFALVTLAGSSSSTPQGQPMAAPAEDRSVALAAMH